MSHIRGTYRGPPKVGVLRGALESLDSDREMEEAEDETTEFALDDGTRYGFRALSKRASKAAQNGSAADVVFARTDFEDLRATVQQLGTQMNTIANALHQVLGAGATTTIPVTLDLPLMDSHNKSAVSKKAKKQRVTPDIVYSAEVYPHDAPRRSQTRTPKLVKSILPLRVRQSRKQEKLTKQLEDAYAAGDLPVFEVHKYVSGAKIGRFGRRFVGISRSSSSSSDSSGYDEPGYSRHFDLLDDPYPKSTTLDGSYEIVQEAGTLLRIYSPHIMRAIESIAGNFPGLSRESQSLVVHEPFCALLYFRDELLLGEPVDLGSQDSRRMENDDRGSDATDSDAHSSEDDTQTREDAISHMKILYSFVDTQYLSAITREKERWRRKIPQCTFEWLWLLFPPQELVYEGSVTNTIEMQAYQVKSFSLEGPFKYDDDDKPVVNPKRLRRRDKLSAGHSINRVNIRVTYRTHDGRKTTLRTKLFVIYPFKGEKSIHELEIYPARFQKDPEGATRDRLIQRGRRYLSLATRGQFDYHGETFSGVRRHLDARIVVDSETYFYAPKATKTGLTTDREAPLSDSRDRLFREPVDQDYEDSHSEDPDPYRRNLRNSNRWRGRATKRFQATAALKRLKLSLTEELPDEQYIICPPIIQAYILKERLWELLAVESISECVYNESLLDELQISNDARRLVQALSRNYKIASKNSSAQEHVKEDQQGPWSSDFVPNKGGGQIILLHGKPGVGKTTTAECIAELSHRPLLTITCGDLGTHAYDIQRELERWLHLGTLWNGVLLFDEADVFLESRTHGDIERNSIISVFLRAIEYHTGLMFLTTNRIGSFDEAVLSRIHAVLHLPNLTTENRREIWDTSFRKIADERPNIKVDFALMNYAYNDEKIRKLNWNGREIRNAFNTMIALAEWDAHHNDKYTKDGKIMVTRLHLEEVATMSGTFKSYLEELRGMTDDEHMRSQGIRGT